MKCFGAAGGLALCLGLSGWPAAAGDAAWGYGGDVGPAHWARLDKANSACGTGVQQSSIDIEGAMRAEMPEARFDWKKGDVTLLNNGYTIQVNVERGHLLRRGGKLDELVQFHFHAPSEHHLDGMAYPMEMHFVHRNIRTGLLSVVAVFLTVGGENEAFARLARMFPARDGAKSAIQSFDMMALLPRSRDYWLYEGSMTTPPCAEIVEWVVLSEPLAVASADIERFRALYATNARPLAERNRRFILTR